MAHIVKPYIDGDHIGLDFECTEPETANCRLRCPSEESCEEFYVEWIDGKPWHVGYRFDDETDEETEGPLHEMSTGNPCGVIEFDALDEGFGDQKTPLREGEIEFAWNGDFYEWRYVGPVMTVKVSNLQGDNVTEHVIPVSLWERIQAVRGDDDDQV